MSEDQHEKTYGLSYDALQTYRKLAEEPMTKFGGGTVIMLAPDLLKLLNAFARLQSENLGLLKEKGELMYDLSVAEEAARTDITTAIFARDRLRSGYDYPPYAAPMCPGCTNDGKVVTTCGLHTHIFKLRDEVANADAEAKVLRDVIAWQAWLLDEVEDQKKP